MSGLNRMVVMAGLGAAMSHVGQSFHDATIAIRNFDVAARERPPVLNLRSFFADRGPRGKGRNKNPRRHSGVAAAKRAALKLRNRRKS